jgi:hypothetical protein
MTVCAWEAAGIISQAVQIASQKEAVNLNLMGFVFIFNRGLFDVLIGFALCLRFDWLAGFNFT